MKKLNFLNILLMIGLFVLFCLTFDLAIGSYQESEPQAGNILFSFSFIIIIAFASLIYKLKKHSILKK